MKDALSPGETPQELAELILSMPLEVHQRFMEYVSHDDRPERAPQRRKTPTEPPGPFRVRRVELPW